ncbi:GAF domain-containing protein, partial [bacterium]
TDEYRFLKADDSWVVVQDRGFVVFDKTGKPVRMVGAMTDVTEERRAWANQAFLRELTESLIDLRDADEIIDTAERMLGQHLGASRVAYGDFEKDEDAFTVRKDWAPGLGPAEGRFRLSDFGGRVEANLRSGTVDITRDVEFEFDGDLLDRVRSNDIRSAITVPILREGRLASIFVVHDVKPRDWREDEVALVRQVTDRLASEIERSRAEASLRDAKENLERTVAERTAKLQESMEEAERFNYSISHDLRTPLRAISATAQILLEEAEGLDSYSRELLERQAYNAQRLGLLIDQLLRFSRLGRVEMTRTRLDVTTIARAVADEIVQADATLACSFEIQEGMSAEGDQALVRLVFGNLLENACKFSKGQGAVRVRQENNTFSVSDEGVGFD